MTVAPFVYRDYAGRPEPLTYSHEVNASISIIQHLWSALHDQDVFYAVVCNLHEEGRSAADMVIVSERGVGVLELKHHPGLVTRLGDDWYAGMQRIVNGRGLNPQQQVAYFAENVRERLFASKPEWKTAQTQRRRVQLQAAICFTNQDALISDFQRLLLQEHALRVEDNRFNVLTPEQVAEWAVGLSFELSLRSPEFGGGYEPLRLWPEEVVSFVTEDLDAVEWHEIDNLMPRQPYGVLTLLEDATRLAVFNLDKMEVIVGRDPAHCNVVIPEQYARASKRHLALRRYGRQVWINDLGSTNGTYVNGQRLVERTVLRHGQRITLGGSTGSDKVCTLKFLPSADYEPERTERQTSRFFNKEP